MYWLLAVKHPGIAQELKTPEKEEFSVRIVASALSDPWEVTFVPDAHLCVTESKSYWALRINVTTHLVLMGMQEISFPDGKIPYY